MEEIYVGIDIHRDYGVACVQDTKGTVVDEFRFGNDIEGINKVKERLNGNNMHIAIESTGNMWVVLWDKLEEIESDLHLVHPLKTKAIASNKLKNDKLDAKGTFVNNLTIYKGALCVFIRRLPVSRSLRLFLIRF